MAYKYFGTKRRVATNKKILDNVYTIYGISYGTIQATSKIKREIKENEKFITVNTKIILEKINLVFWYLVLLYGLILLSNPLNETSLLFNILFK